MEQVRFACPAPGGLARSGFTCYLPPSCPRTAARTVLFAPFYPVQICDAWDQKSTKDLGKHERAKLVPFAISTCFLFPLVPALVA